MDQSNQVPPRNKEELLERIRISHEELERAFARLAPERMDEPLLEGGWSPKDVLAHIAGWHRLTLARLKAHADPDELARIESELFTGETDELNERLYKESRDLPIHDVRITYNNSYSDLMALLEEMPEDDLLLPNRSTLWNGEPLGRLVAGNTYLHYPEHREAIEGVVEGTDR
ncbi:MAG: ClbS/DfsB family four-helix bundle protein [Chloroflexota bacterium]|nr:ClbS/DfsB family four-helix bundle protein [Chloroflexota bacterium]